jgi:hypothetical protein
MAKQKVGERSEEAKQNKRLFQASSRTPSTPSSTYHSATDLQRWRHVQQRPVHLAYQTPASSTFLSEQISHQQPASSIFISERINTSHQPPTERTCCKSASTKRLLGVFPEQWM